ncbi:MAG: TetR/AcrR family transcriptional regulator [bacterium]|nr:TetR/AcrR family transcriptional regulator [bacterium]
MTETPRKVDRRVQRTRTLLRDALMKLIVERGYENITVQDIADAADVARATFYLHYKDKEELLFQSMEEVYDALLERVGPVRDDYLTQEGLPVDVIAFQHTAEYAPFYRVMLSERGAAAYVVRLRHYLAKVLWDTVCQKEPHLKGSIIGQAVMHHEAGALIATISWWLENEMPFPAEDMAWLVHNLSEGGVLGLIEKAPKLPSEG